MALARKRKAVGRRQPAKATPRRRPTRTASPEQTRERDAEVRIGVRLKYARLSKGYTLAQLADIVKCSESMISKV